MLWLGMLRRESHSNTIEIEGNYEGWRTMTKDIQCFSQILQRLPAKNRLFSALRSPEVVRRGRGTQLGRLGSSQTGPGGAESPGEWSWRSLVEGCHWRPGSKTRMASCPKWCSFETTYHWEDISSIQIGTRTYLTCCLTSARQWSGSSRAVTGLSGRLLCKVGSLCGVFGYWVYNLDRKVFKMVMGQFTLVPWCKSTKIAGSYSML